MSYTIVVFVSLYPLTEVCGLWIFPRKPPRREPPSVLKVLFGGVFRVRADGLRLRTGPLGCLNPQSPRLSRLKTLRVTL